MATVTTATVALNPAFLQEIKEDHQDLWRLLCTMRNLAANEHFNTHVVRRWADLLADLRDRLAMHFALEEAYGYFEDAIDVAPRLSEAAIALRDQHRELYVACCDLADAADALAHRHHHAADCERIVEAFLAFEADLTRHERTENDLIQKAFTDEIGAAD